MEQKQNRINEDEVYNVKPNLNKTSCCVQPFSCRKEAVSELYNMDCIQGMKHYPDKYFDLAIVDPPYGIGIAEWDFVKPNYEYFLELFRVSKNQIIWGGNYFAHLLPETESWICWNKKPFLKQQAHFELAWTSFDIKPKMYDYTYAGNAEGINNLRVDYNKKSIHPCQKPVNIYNLILNDFAVKGQKILDTHVGSGSSRISCYQNGFDFVGFEIDKQYCEASEKYFVNAISQQRLSF